MHETHRRAYLGEAVGIGLTALLLLVWAGVMYSPVAILVVGLITISCVNYYAGHRDVLYPAFIYTSIWSLVAAAFFFCPVDIDPLRWKTIGIFLAGGASFSIGSWIGNRPVIGKRSKSSKGAKPDLESEGTQARNLFLACTVILTIVFLIVVLKNAGGLLSLGLQMFVKLNAPDSPLADAGGISSIIMASGGFFPVLTLWVLMMEERQRWKIKLCFLCACIFPLVITQRGLVTGAFCGCVTLWLLKKKDRSLRSTAAPLAAAALTIVSLLTVMSLTKYWVQQPGGISITDGMWRYITGPLAAFDHAVYHPGEYRDQPAAVFSQVLTPLSRLQVIHYQTWMEVDGSSLDRFVEVPFPANVYTAYKPYYEDFGAFGCFVAFAFLGAIEGQLFHWSLRGNRFAILFLAHLSGSLMFATFDDNYHGFSRHINVVLFALLYFGVMRHVRISLLGRKKGHISYSYEEA